MKQLYMIIALASCGMVMSARDSTQIRVVNGTSHELTVALASDYQYYSVPDYGYYSITLAGSHPVSPWITDWVSVAPGATQTFDDTYWVCPEYVVLKDDCQLHGQRATKFEKGITYPAVALFKDTKATGSQGRHTCSGDATVTFAASNKAKYANGCHADVAVSGTLQVKN